MKNSKIDGVRTQMHKRILTTALLALGIASVGGCSQSNKSEQADKALPTASSSLPQTLPTAAPSNSTANLEAVVTQYWTANDKCRGGSGDSPDTDSACNRREEIAKQLEQSGWCLGNVGEWVGDQKWHKCTASSLNGGKGAAASSPGKVADLSTIRNWKCDGASGPFRMTFSNFQNDVKGGKWGNVKYSPSSPFGFEGDDGFDYERKSSVITIGANPESGEQGISFKLDNQRGEMVFVSGESGDSIVCKPA